MSFGKSDPPPTPDYTGAAVAQGAANRETAIASSRLNNPNVRNPYGTQTWTENGPDGRPTLTQRLAPEQQALLNQQNQTRGLLGGLGIQGATALQGVVGRNLDMSGIPTAPGNAEATRNSVFDAMMSRVNQDTQGQRDSANSDMIARGIAPGTKAYSDAQHQIDRQYNDARQQALIGAGQEGQRDFNMDTQRRRDAIAEMLTGRQTPLNEINALMSGSQVSNPFAVPGAAQNTNIAPAPLFGAAQAQYGSDLNNYNAQQAQGGNMMNGLFGLGSAAIQYSDRRLKINIQRIGTHILGIGLYAWDYLWGEHSEGVIADEVLTVMPEAVLQHPSGFMMVDYGMLNHANT